MTASSRIKLADLTFGENVTRTSLNLGDNLSSQQDREVDKVLELLKDRPLSAIAKYTQGELYQQLRGELVDAIGIATPSLLRTVRQIHVAASRQLEAKRLQLVNRTVGGTYTLEELANMSLFDLLKMIVNHPYAVLYVEDLLAQRVKRVTGPWVVPTAESKDGTPRIHVDATLRHVHRFDGLAEVTDPPIRDGVPVQPITLQEAFKTCGVL